MTRLRSSLARHVASAPDPDGTAALAARLWRERGMVALRPEDIPDPWRRQVVIQEAERLYGPINGRNGR